mmetsp:Transcript_21614/g.38607  ORF Transcript_21614/g.38607 Transcript_21614/m.38607 type:complete len:119 (-) Transcript_21614:751-1107(-)
MEEGGIGGGIIPAEREISPAFILTALAPSSLDSPLPLSFPSPHCPLSQTPLPSNVLSALLPPATLSTLPPFRNALLSRSYLTHPFSSPDQRELREEVSENLHGQQSHALPNHQDLILH